MKRFWLLFAGLSLLILIIFGIWGDGIEAFFNPEQTEEFLKRASTFAGPVGAGLLISDIALPIPTTIIIGALGATLGTVQGACWGWLGLVLAGWTGYGAGRWGGSAWKHRLISPEEEARFSSYFNRQGGLAIILSRMLPILPEVLSILAGLYNMAPARFGVALMLGSIPPAVLYSLIGSTARETPVVAGILLVVLTSGCWVVYLRLKGRPPITEKD